MIISCLQQTKLKHMKTDTESKRLEKICHTNSTQKKANITVLISVKVDVDTRCVSREMEKHFTMIK